MENKTNEGLTIKSAKVLEILKARKGEFLLAEEIANCAPEIFEKGAKSVTPVMNSLVKKELVVKDKKEVVTPGKPATDMQGNQIATTVSKVLTVYSVTKAGEELVYFVKAAN